ncbi:MAG: M1 family aminopeptidase [Lysobacterales bacterium]|jgi:hypothetical protein
MSSRFSICLCALVVSLSWCAAASANHISHHQLSVVIDPSTNSLAATDVITISGDDPGLFLYLGQSFSWESMSQGERELTWELVKQGGRGESTLYRVDGWDPAGGPLSVSWQGTLAEFRGYGVSIIRDDLVELSGFIGWFPTIELSSQSESFTYTMELRMPDGWVVLSPRDGPFRADDGGKMEFIHQAAPTQDVFICAAPGFERYQIGGVDSGVMLYSLPQDDFERIREDFEAVVSLCTEWFGEPAASKEIVAILSHRRGGAEWGYERGVFWVNGDGFVSHLLANDWVSRGLKKSLAAHETIHTWFGKSLGFEQAWLMEAVTQYLEVVVTAELFKETDLPARYFARYRERFMATEDGFDIPVSALAIDQNHYDHWYLKGSWAFWDLEALTGREKLIAALSALYKEHDGSVISDTDFRASLEQSLGVGLEPFFRHWFDGPGFEPLYRGDPGAQESQGKTQ